MTFILLDNTRDENGEAWLFENPYAIIQADRPEEVAAAIEQLEQATRNGDFVAGFFSYEMGYVLEPRLTALLPENRKVPLLWFGVFKSRQKFSSQEAETWLRHKAWSRHIPISAQASELKPVWQSSDYLKRFDKAKYYIEAGDLYQLNLTFKTHFDFSGDPIKLYLKLRKQQPVSYGAYIHTADFNVLSLSPELFIKQQNDVIETKPMKGTAPRAYLSDEDKAVAAALARDTKSQAENLMIVDLMRNDFGRIAQTGSVKVSDLFHVDTYKTLHQMISTVTARVKENLSLLDMLKALFPAGSITGTPKIRAQEIIRELEDEPRGVYCGAIGMMGKDEKSFNVAIRTAVLFPKQDDIYDGEMAVGSGVVYDSVGTKEYEECLLKTRFFSKEAETFGLIETLRYDDGKGFYLLDRHLERLRCSAHYFGFKFSEASIRGFLENYFDHLEDDIKEGLLDRLKPHYRVRIVLWCDGHIESSCVPMTLAESVFYMIANAPIHSQNIHLYHKTTKRDFLDAPCKALKQQTCCDEVVYLNERGEVTQGSYTNVFIDRGDGVLLTPPVSAGLLPGTLRAELIATRMVVEKTLYPKDLNEAKTVYLGNSVRGLLVATLLK